MFLKMAMCLRLSLRLSDSIASLNSRTRREGPRAFHTYGPRAFSACFARIDPKDTKRRMFVFVAGSNILSPLEAAAVPLTEGEIKKKMNKKMWERIRRKMKNIHKT
ncbi:hypothetical protein Tco_0121668 [Tanacetum coccineum]